LSFPEVWTLVAGRRHRVEPATLAGYRRARVRSAPYPGILPAHGGRVAGVVWHGVACTALRRLDEFEGDLYRRVRLRVDVGGSACDAFAYVVEPSHAHRLAAEPWSEETFRTRDLGAYLEGCLRFARAWDARA